MSSNSKPSPLDSGAKRSSVKQTVRSLVRLGKGFSLRGTSFAAGRFLRTELWVWPVIAALALSVIGWWVNGAVERTMQRQVTAAVGTIRDADATGTRIWLKEQEANAKILAMSEGVRPLVQKLMELANKSQEPEKAVGRARELIKLRDYLAPRIKVFGYPGFFVVAPNARVIASSLDETIGKTVRNDRWVFFENVLAHGPSVIMPFRNNLRLANEQGELKTGLPTMVVAAPIFNADGKPLAILAMRIRPEAQFTDIFRVGRTGETGETYAIDRAGLLLTQSRFDNQLKRVGLLADVPDSQSLLTLEARNPGVNMEAGARPALARADQPLTRSAADCAAGNSGVDALRYRNYAGVPVVGAWTWINGYNFGIITEIAAAEAYRPLAILRWTFWSLFALLVASAVVIFLFMVLVERKHREVQKAVQTARQLGQYTLGEKIGTGGMGTVYKATHRLLRRPTAVKLLNADKYTDEAAERFEREVQLTSQLNHPNTITVYDYGRTPEGVFFYAMEYLDGLNLEDLVSREGALPEGRVVRILRQLCGSLAEAHRAGLIHRDIKPSNIIVNYRGGQADFVKVLDFGLAKAVGDGEGVRLTAPNTMAGTPLYLSPEAIERPDTVDARADIYAIGAVGYYLLTGTPVFPGQSIVEICMQHVRTPPEPPSRRLGRPVSPRFEAVLLRCLEKDRERRPPGARVLLEELLACDADAGWSQAAAEQWWTDFTRPSAPPAPTPTPTRPSPAVTNAAGPSVVEGATVVLSPEERGLAGH